MGFLLLSLPLIILRHHAAKTAESDVSILSEDQKKII